MTVAIADRERVEEKAHARIGEQLVGGELVRRYVVRLRLDAAAEERMRRGERIHALQPREHLVGDAMHHLPVLALDLRMQPAEVRQPRRGAGAAEKAVALDQRRRAPGPRRGRGCGDAGGSAAEHDDLVLRQHCGLAFRLVHEHTIELCKLSCDSLRRRLK